jgi:hypothetical protein
MRNVTFPAALVAALLVAGCTGGVVEQQQAVPRAVVTISDRNVREGSGNQATFPAGVNCVPGQPVTVEVQLTGNFTPQAADAVIGEALCGEQVVTTARARAQGPIGFATDIQTGTQVEGPARCRASWIFIPSPNKPVWEVECRFN